MRCRTVTVSLVLVAAVLSVATSPVNARDIGQARRDIAAARYGDAEAALIEIARSAGADDKQEALYLLGGLKRSVSEAEIVYQEVIRLDPSSRWGIAAQVELAKVRYAVGEYGAAYDMLDGASACRKSDEACYIEGLCAAMLKRYDDAKELLSKVKSDRHRWWAALALADIDAGMDDREESCRRYRSMARSSPGPTALYRFGECLEERGDLDGAKDIFNEVVAEYRDTPEALLAGEKLTAIRIAASADGKQGKPAETAGPQAVADEPSPLTTGYTLQFGSFADRANAIKLAAELKRKLPGVRIDSDLLRFKEVHRVRYGYFKSRGEAQRRADEISKQTGEQCAIMPLP